MSLFTEAKKTKSLWHPITDEDFNIDFSKPVIICTEECSLLLVDGVNEMFDYVDDETFYDRETQSLTDKGKEWFRDSYYAYMYVDGDFFKAVEPNEKEYIPCYRTIDEVKGTAERPYLFVMFENGEMEVYDHFDFGMDGSYSDEGLRWPLRFDDDEKVIAVPIKYVVNLNHCLQTSMDAIFLQTI